MIHDQIRSRGVFDERVLAVIEAVPREMFLPKEQCGLAYEDRALPVGFGQTISQPYIVAYMTEQLEVRPESRVLEVGTGTGYQTAILARLAAQVYSVERITELAQRARGILAMLGIANATITVGDGSRGLPSAQPFDRIIVTAAAPKVPDALSSQLADGGLMIVPVGGANEQTIVRVERFGTRLIETPMLACRFVKLIGEEGWDAESPGSEPKE
jgi:protein-L-isoaspartate(D-aspartate) O-methyltransferase